MQILHPTNIEEIIIGTILVNSSTIAITTRYLTPEMFRDSRLSIIYRHAEELFRTGINIDVLTLKKTLSKAGQLTETGGPAYIMQLINDVKQEINIESYIRTLKEDYLRRQFANTLNELSSKTQNDQQNLEDLLIETRRSIESIENSYLCNRHLHSLPELMQQSLNKLEKHRAGYFLTGIPTGIHELDILTCGWQPGQLIILTSQPSIGKTALGLHVAQTAAKADYKVIVYSMELPGEQLADRMLVTEGAPTNSEQSVNEEKMKQAYAIARNLSHLPLLIDDRARISMSHIRTSALLRQSKGICDLLVIDSLQLCDTSSDSYISTRKPETEEIVYQAKLLAMELKLPVLLISQFNNELQKVAEQYADIVILLQRLPSATTKGSISITKHRNGATKEIHFTY